MKSIIIIAILLFSIIAQADTIKYFPVTEKDCGLNAPYGIEEHRSAICKEKLFTTIGDYAKANKLKIKSFREDVYKQWVDPNKFLGVYVTFEDEK